MKGKSLIVGILAAISIVITTEVVYHFCNDIKTKYETKNTPKVSATSTMEQQEENLTPKQKEICKYKSQLLFLLSDEARISTVNQNILNYMRVLLQSKTSGVLTVNKTDVEKTKTEINDYWAKNNIFGSNDGVELKGAYNQYLDKLNAYLDGGIQTGQLNVSDLPKFGESNMQKIDADINSVKVQLLGLGASVNLSSPTYFTYQNTHTYNGYT